MKHKPLTITFHNPNNEKESEILAMNFIAQASKNVVKKFILEHEEKLSDKPKDK